MTRSDDRTLRPDTVRGWHRVMHDGAVLQAAGKACKLGNRGPSIAMPPAIQIAIIADVRLRGFRWKEDETLPGAFQD